MPRQRVKEPEKKFFTIQETSQKLGVSEATVRNWVARGQVEFFRIGPTKRPMLEKSYIESLIEFCPQPEYQRQQLIKKAS